jgi:mannose-6-phosphate isomerase
MESISTALGKGLAKSLRAFFTAFIELDHPRQKELISAAVSSIKKADDREPAFAWVTRLNRVFPDEVMVLSPLLLNLIHLNPGEAVMIHPGTLHAYLVGAGVELMANSDNVIRAGLTHKTKNAAELLRIVSFHQEDAKILGAEKRDGAEWFYPSEAEEFALSLISTTKHTPHVSSKTHSLEIMICVAGRGCITDLNRGRTLSVARGISFLVPATVGQYRIDGRVTIYKASVPLE